jgi:hypothetical protein
VVHDFAANSVLPCYLGGAKDEAVTGASHLLSFLLRSGIRSASRSHFPFSSLPHICVFPVPSSPPLLFDVPLR